MVGGENGVCARISMTNISKQDEKYMWGAIEAARIAEENGDVPIGAVVIEATGLSGRRQIIKST